MPLAVKRAILPLVSGADGQLSEAQQAVVQRLCALAEQVGRVLPEADPPFVGHLRVRTGGRLRDVLIGARTHVEEPLVVVDWRRAPLAEVFFGMGEGEEYEIEARRRTLTGTVLERHVVKFEDGEPVCIRAADSELVKEAGSWTARPPRSAVCLTPRKMRRASSPTLVELDEAQEHAVQRPPGTPVLVLGDAGYGKTTVALHRLAYLRAQAVAAGKPFAALVVVPTEGLRRLTVRMLTQLGVTDGEVTSFERWIRRQGRRVFSDVPSRDSQEVGPLVSRFKRHPALRVVLGDVARGTPAMRELGEVHPERSAGRRDLIHLFGDRTLLERVKTAAHGVLTGRALDEVLAHTRTQFSRTTEERYAHVDAERLRTVDGRAIDDATPWHNANSIDTEDFAVLFALNRIKTSEDATEAGKLQTYDHVLVDEAQEFSPLELAVLGHATNPSGTVTVAGDEKQQVDETASFSDWSGVMQELGSGHHEQVVLQASYRCPPPVEGFARSLFPARATGVSPVLGPEDVPLVWTRFDSPAHRCAGLIEALVEFRDRDLQAAVAVICRHKESAQRMHAELSMGLDVRLALDGQFRFSPGISVTCVDEVKGLEFDVVVIPDASASSYPDDMRARKALYVATTRATHQLWMVTAGNWSPLTTGFCPV